MKNNANLNDDFQDDPLQDKVQAPNSPQSLSGAEGRMPEEQDAGLSS